MRSFLLAGNSDPIILDYTPRDINHNEKKINLLYTQNSKISKPILYGSFNDGSGMCLRQWQNGWCLLHE